MALLEFRVIDFVDETHPAYHDREGDSPWRLQIESLPTYGTLVLEGGTTIKEGDTLHILDANNLSYNKDEAKTEEHVDNFTFRIADIGSKNYSNIGTITINVPEVPFAPTVDNNSAILDSKVFIFSLGSFTKNFADQDGDSYSDVTLVSLPKIPSLKLDGGTASKGEVFPVVESTELKYHLPDNYAAYNSTLYEFEKSINTIIFEAESANYKLISNENGILTFGKNGRSYDIMTVQGTPVDSDALCFNFTTSDDSEDKLPSNVAKFCLTVQGDINIKEVYINQPATVGNNTVNILDKEEFAFDEGDFTTNTTPAYYDTEGDLPKTLKVVTLPTEGKLTLRGSNILVGDEIGVAEIDDVLYTTNKTNTAAHSVTFTFRIEDEGSGLYSNTGTMTINVPETPIAPTVDNNSAFLTDKIFTFSLGSFTKNFTDLDGDSYSDVTLITLPKIPSLRLEGGNASKGEVFPASGSSELKYHLPDNYAVYNGTLYEFDKSINSIIFEAESADYKLIDNEDGILLFGKNGREYDTMSIRGTLIDSDALRFSFTTSDNSEDKLPSNIATFSLIPQGNINIKEVYVNKAPTVGDKDLNILHAGEFDFNRQDFTTNTTPPYYDIEGDLPETLKIVSLPSEGKLTLRGSNITNGNELEITELDDILYEANNNNTTAHTDTFTFRIKDKGSGKYSNTGTITINVAEKVASPPTVDDSSSELTDNTYQFAVEDFTRNFIDPDGDTYKLTKVETLPYVGDLLYNGGAVSAGFEFDLSNINNFRYTLPSNYVLSPTGYCKFDEPIEDIITNQAAEGFELVNREIGSLKFEKNRTVRIPNEADVYAFFDTTSMELSDATSAQESLVSFFNKFKNENPLYVGNLYILPIFQENWLDFPSIINRGSSKEVGNNPDRPNDDFMPLSIIPPNFNVSNNDPNLNWVSPTEIVILGFIDEVEGEIEGVVKEYHKDKNGYGFEGQPSTQYLTDYKNFIEVKENFDFFRGVLYPIPDIEYRTYNNIGNAMVLQGFSAIEGGATYSLPEIEYLGVTYAKERRFHWYLDPSHPNYTGTNPTVANPYSAEANTPVPGTSYNLQGLKEFGWIGTYDKDQPASAVFTSSSFDKELGEFLKGSETSSVQTRIIEGECTSNVNICFDFKTSDNSVEEFFSNTATFCLSPSIINSPPTVSDNSAPLRIKKYVFNNSDFTKNFTDPDGDSYSMVTIKKLTETRELKLIGNSVSVGDSFRVTNSNNLTYELDDRYAVYGGTVYDFGRSIDSIISDFSKEGYKLSENSNGRLKFVGINNEANSSVILGTLIPNSKLCFNFTTSDDGILNLDSNIATFCLIPEGNINIKPIYQNDPPIVGDNEVTTYYSRAYVYKRADFVEDTTPIYSDPEKDAPYQLRIDSLPSNGKLYLRNVEIGVGEVLMFLGDVDSNEFKYVPNSNRFDIEQVRFDFSISDVGSKIFVQ